MTLEMRDLENQEIGSIEERRKIIRNMLQKGKNAEEISDLCGISISEINTVQDQMLFEAAGVK